MDGQCNWKDIVYEAEVCLENQARGEGMLYLGQASGPWKLRYNNHTKAFRNRSQRAHCELANHVWDLKDREKNIQDILEDGVSGNPLQQGLKKMQTMHKGKN